MNCNQLQWVIMTKLAATKYALKVLEQEQPLTPTFEELQTLIENAFHAGCSAGLMAAGELLEFPSLGGTPVDAELQTDVLRHRIS